MDYRNHFHIRSSLDGDDHLYKAPKDLPPLPDIPQVSFFCPQNSAENLVVESLKALGRVSNKDLLTRNLIPWMLKVPTDVEDDLNFPKLALANWVAKTSPPYSEDWRKDVFSRPIVPLPVLEGQRHYRCLSEMVDPRSAIAPLYDPDERRFPCPDFYTTHSGVLLSYGLLSQPIWSTPLARIQYLSQRPERVDITKVKGVLNLPVLRKLLQTDSAVQAIRSLKWLPGSSKTGQSLLLAPKDCRDAQESHLVDRVLPTTVISVESDSWKALLSQCHGSICP